MVDIRSLPLQAVHIAPVSGTQQAYVVIMQVVVHSSQIPFKCSIAKPPEKVRVSTGNKAQKAGMSKWRDFFFLLPLNQENLS